MRDAHAPVDWRGRQPLPPPSASHSSLTNENCGYHTQGPASQHRHTVRGHRDPVRARVRDVLSVRVCTGGPCCGDVVRASGRARGSSRGPSAGVHELAALAREGRSCAGGAQEATRSRHPANRTAASTCEDVPPQQSGAEAALPPTLCTPPPAARDASTRPPAGLPIVRRAPRHPPRCGQPGDDRASRKK